MFNTKVSNKNFRITNVPKGVARDGISGCPHFFGDGTTIRVGRFNGQAEKVVKKVCPVCGTSVTQTIRYNDNQVAYGGY